MGKHYYECGCEGAPRGGQPVPGTVQVWKPHPQCGRCHQWAGTRENEYGRRICSTHHLSPRSWLSSGFPDFLPQNKSYAQLAGSETFRVGMNYSFCIPGSPACRWHVWGLSIIIVWANSLINLFSGLSIHLSIDESISLYLLPIYLLSLIAFISKKSSVHVPIKFPKWKHKFSLVRPPEKDPHKIINSKCL